MEINCLSCGFKLDLDDEAYSDYEGLAKCYVCSGLLEIRIADGKVKSVQLAEGLGAPLGEMTTRYGSVALG